MSGEDAAREITGEALDAVAQPITTMLRAALLLQTVQAANYFPGIAPASYSPEQKLPLYVNKLTSTHTQIPYDYYSLPFLSLIHI